MLFPHLCIPMNRQTFSSQDKALEAAMRLEATPLEGATIKLQQIQEQVEVMHQEIQNL